AVQDVAIDALAVDTLAESERGVANGLMFAGASAGSAFGGTGALWMYKAGGFSGATLLVASGLLLVLTTVSISLRERPTPNRDDTGSVRPIRSELTAYLRTAGRAFFGSRTGRLGVVFALLPAGAYALSLPLQSNLAVELGMSLDEIGWLNLATTLTFALLCVTGGFVSDRIGRRRSLAIFIALTTIPTVLFAVLLWKAGWVMPIENPKAPDRPMPPDWLVTAFWAASILFNIANGLMYGTRSAFYMDFCDPKVAATQFTAYMALMNLVISYTSFWQGWSIKTLGYPTTLVLDAAFGLVCLAVLAAVPFVRRPDRAAVPEAATEGRCPVCGADVSAEDAVCRKCGERLRAES
ncbi:MAG TPA: MFS transporter, partial [Planctomycetaceae bacterium]